MEHEQNNFALKKEVRMLKSQFKFLALAMALVFAVPDNASAMSWRRFRALCVETGGEVTGNGHDCVWCKTIKVGDATAKKLTILSIDSAATLQDFEENDVRSEEQDLNKYEEKKIDEGKFFDEIGENKAE